MSRNAWQEGTILLPTKEATRVKRAVIAAQNRENESTYTRARDWWRRNGRKYRATDTSYPDQIEEISARPSSGYDDYEDRDPVYDTLWQWKRDGKMSKAAVIPERATNKTKTFYVNSEAFITFDGRKVTWTVHENNHAPERANASPIAKAFFAALDQVNWTRGSGGEIVGNDEYNRDARESGYGGNYTCKAYGPKGGRGTGRVQESRATRRMLTGSWY